MFTPQFNRPLWTNYIYILRKSLGSHYGICTISSREAQLGLPLDPSVLLYLAIQSVSAMSRAFTRAVALAYDHFFVVL